MHVDIVRRAQPLGGLSVHRCASVWVFRSFSRTPWEDNCVEWRFAPSAVLTAATVLLGYMLCAHRTERLRGAVVCYGIQNMCIAVSAAAAAALVLLDASANGQLLTTRPVSECVYAPADGGCATCQHVCGCCLRRLLFSRVFVGHALTCTPHSLRSIHPPHTHTHPLLRTLRRFSTGV